MRADIRLRAVGPPVRVGALPFSFVFVFFAFLVPSKIVRRTAEPTSHRFLIKIVFFFKSTPVFHAPVVSLFSFHEFQDESIVYSGLYRILFLIGL